MAQPLVAVLFKAVVGMESDLAAVEVGWAGRSLVVQPLLNLVAAKATFA